MTNVGLTLLRLVMKKYNITLSTNTDSSSVVVSQEGKVIKESAAIDYNNIIEGEWSW